jgi:Organic solute transporter Ostalpha
MKKYKIFYKLLIIKLSILFTDVQPLVIQIFATTGTIANNSLYRTEDITAYTNALLLCAEMGICCILVFITFPTSDFEISEFSKLEKDFENVNTTVK